MARRRRRRQGVGLHPGVTLLSPTGGRKYYRLRWRDGERYRYQSTKLETRSLAIQEAIKLAGRLKVPEYETDLTWGDFCARYEEEHFGEAPAKTISAWRTARAWFTNLMQPEMLEDVTPSMVSRFRAKLRQALLVKNDRAPPTTIRSYLKQISAALNWAVDHRLLLDRVHIEMPKRAKRGKLARSRPITLEEFERIVARAETVRPNDYPQWQRLLWGYWHSGLRLRELLALSWDEDAELGIETRYRYPLLRLGAGGQKSAEAQYHIVTPEFWALVEDADPKAGPVFPVLNQRNGKPYDADWVGRVIARCGKGVRTGLGSDKTATSHDLGKRSWTTRMGAILNPNDLAEVARHKSGQTTKDYYYMPSLETLAEKVGWGKEE